MTATLQMRQSRPIGDSIAYVQQTYTQQGFLCRFSVDFCTLPVLAKPCNRVISKKAMIGNMMAVKALMGSQYSCRTFPVSVNQTNTVFS